MGGVTWFYVVMVATCGFMAGWCAGTGRPLAALMALYLAARAARGVRDEMRMQRWGAEELSGKEHGGC